MDWLTEIAENLITRIDIDNADSEEVVRGVEFIDWTGPIQIGLTGDKNQEVQRLFRPFTASLRSAPDGKPLRAHDLGIIEPFSLVIDLLEGQAWVNSSYCRLSPVRDIRMIKH